MRFLILLSFAICTAATAATFDGQVSEWTKKSETPFKNPEENFKFALKTLRENYIDSHVTEAELYRAATAGMLAALNSGKPGEDWNVLYSPRELRSFMIEKSGRLTGIGATLEFDPKTGYARVMMALPDSAAEKSGLKSDDLILSVDGEVFKGKALGEMVEKIRGPAGKSVALKVLRGDRVLSMTIRREKIDLPGFEQNQIDSKTSYLSLGYFSKETRDEMENALKRLTSAPITKLILDLRGNGGGTFEDGIHMTGLFLSKNSIVAKTAGRSGRTEEYKAQTEQWRPDVRVIVLIDKNTASSAELLAGVLREQRHAVLIGATTQGKWDVQSVDTLPNQFAMKYSVMKFETPLGESFQGVGLKPDLEVNGPQGLTLARLAVLKDMRQRTNQDAVLKAAAELGVQ